MRRWTNLIMQPIDFRNATFAELRARLTGLRSKVWVAWIAHGPATTRRAAQLSGIDLLTFRPRSTELYQLGAIMLVDEPPYPGPLSGSEGYYRARTDAEWQAWQERIHEGFSHLKQFQLL